MAVYSRNMSPKQITDSFIVFLIIYVVFVDGNIPLYVTTPLVNIVILLLNVYDNCIVCSTFYFTVGCKLLFSHVLCTLSRSPSVIKMITFVYAYYKMRMKFQQNSSRLFETRQWLSYASNEVRETLQEAVQITCSRISAYACFLASRFNKVFHAKYRV